MRVDAARHDIHAEAPAGTMSIGLNWMIIHAGVDTIVRRNGATGGYHAYISFEPSRKTGVIVMTNFGGTGADHIGFHFLDPDLPLAPKSRPPKQREAIQLPAWVLDRHPRVRCSEALAELSRSERVEQFGARPFLALRTGNS